MRKRLLQKRKKQAEAVQKGNEKLLQEIRKGREDKERARGAQQAKVDQEARSQMFQDFASVAMGIFNMARSFRPGASGSPDEATDFGSVHTPTPPTAARSRPTGSGSVHTATTATAARSRPTRDVDVGPIKNQEHAKEKAREYIAGHPDQEWTGHWTTTPSGKTSVIGVRGSRPTRDVDVGPIMDQQHAERKAREYIAEHPDQEWTGQWTTTSSGTSVIGVRDKA